MNRAQQIFGAHAWNCLTQNYRSDPESIQPEGAQEALDTLLASGASWIKLLWPAHKRPEAEFARNHGLRVMVRAPGEGVVYASDVEAIIAEFAGLADSIEVGNEPPAGDLWRHAWHLEYIADYVMEGAHAAGMKLCTPGWTGTAEPPATGSEIDVRLREVYSRYDQIGVHAYGEHVLDGHIARIGRWHDVFNLPIMLTEVGIAARDLLGVPPDPDRYGYGSTIKALRYAEFVQDCAALGFVDMVAFFIMGGDYHSGFSAFNVNDVYNPIGIRSYYLPKASWALVGDNLRDA